jgi:Ser/Thr protein kinase RdoA (MazF antagonist)
VPTPLASIIRAFGVEPDAIRRVRQRQNTHWRVRAGQSRYALRRVGAWLDVEGDLEWELAVVEQWARAGLPVAQPLGPPREFDGVKWFLMPWLDGRTLGGRAWDGDSWTERDYERLGELLAEVHAATADLPPLPQRPGWGSYVDAALPIAGGAVRRAQLLAAMAEVDAGVADRFDRAAAELEARDLPRLFAGYPRRTIHADFSPWNLRLRQGRLTALLDFELAHVDLIAGDLAQSRRGYHDGVVRGYLRRASLTDAELANLDALWLACIMAGVWRELEQRLARGPIAEVGFTWTLAQLDKIRPFQA